MPGIVLHNRRWAVGSDDCIVPATLLSLTHLAWLTVLLPILITSLSSSSVTSSSNSSETLTISSSNSSEILTISSANSSDRAEAASPDIEGHYRLLVGLYLSVYSVSLVLEVLIIAVSLRGSVINAEPRRHIRPLIYIRQGLLTGEILLLGYSAKWLSDHADLVTQGPGTVLLGLAVTDAVILALILLLTWCAWDPAGRYWVKDKKFQEASQRSNDRDRASHNGQKKSGFSRTWRQRKVRRAYENSWDQRCRMFFCCSLASSRKIRSSFAEIARLLSEFFRDLDVVPSDVLAGLILLRQRQQAARQLIISQPTNNVYDFLSGVKVTNETKFIALDNPSELSVLLDTVHFMHYSMAAYGWPMYVFHNKTRSVAGSMASLCCCVPRCCGRDNGVVTTDNSIMVGDNCCNCNMAAMRQVLRNKHIEIVYATFHVDVGETPFFISVDFSKRVIVITIRGTLSMKDILTDLSAESELIPLQNIDHNWKGHKGMVQSAEYIYNKLMSEDLLSLAHNARPDLGTPKFPVVTTGHSLGAGTAALLAILLRDREYPDVTCYAFSPPGGLISEEAMLASQAFMTSVVVGKDIVPRIGLHQLEMLRHQLTGTLHSTKTAKWKTISSSLPCCDPLDEEPLPDSGAITISRVPSIHQPLYPPGRIIHIVRHHPKGRGGGRRTEPAYQGVWADNKDFDEVLISKRMLQDHMPDNVLDALEKASQVHAWQSAVNTVNLTTSGKSPAEKEGVITSSVIEKVAALSVKEEPSTALTVNSVLSDVINSERNCLPINPDDIGNTKNCDSSKLSESNLNTHPSPYHAVASPPPLSLQPAVKITDKDDGVDNKNCRNDVFDRDLQNCDISISPPGIIQTSSSSTSYVYTKKSEISKNHFEETLRTREISSFYDISNSSTV